MRANCLSSENGFSLVELMVVVAILGLAASAVVLTMQPFGSDAPTEASRLAARIAALRDRAVIEGRPMRMWVAASGYGFEERRANGWAPTTDRAFPTRNWPDGMAITASGGAAARLTFDRLGLPGQSLQIALRRGGAAALINVDATGTVRQQ